MHFTDYYLFFASWFHCVVHTFCYSVWYENKEELLLNRPVYFIYQSIVFFKHRKLWNRPGVAAARSAKTPRWPAPSQKLRMVCFTFRAALTVKKVTTKTHLCILMLQNLGFLMVIVLNNNTNDFCVKMKFFCHTPSSILIFFQSLHNFNYPPDRKKPELLLVRKSAFVEM